jgi:Rod binding domain-containing protein
VSSNSIIAGVLTPNLGGTSADVKSKDSPEKIRDAATQFEALLIGEVLKTAHEGDGEGWLGTGEDQTASSALGLADQFLAQTVAKNGGFGLARMISAGLAKRAASE